MAIVINNSDWQSSGQIIETIIKEAGRKHVCPKCGKEDVPCEVTLNGVKELFMLQTAIAMKRNKKQKKNKKEKNGFSKNSKKPILAKDMQT